MNSKLGYGSNDGLIEEALRSGKYLVTPDGQVWNLDFRGTGSPKKCKQRPNADGYMIVVIGAGSRKTAIFVHRMVLIRYRGRHAEYVVANHKDGVKQHNDLGNLEWLPQSCNVKHAWGKGLRGRFTGQHDGQFKSPLSDDDLREIHRLRNDGKTYGQIGSKLGISRGAAYLICKGKTARRIYEEFHK